MKTKFEYVCNYPDQPNTTVIVETDSESIGGVVDAFRSFLLAAGFHKDNVDEALGEAS